MAELSPEEVQKAARKAEKAAAKLKEAGAAEEVADEEDEAAAKAARKAEKKALKLKEAEEAAAAEEEAAAAAKAARKAAKKAAAEAAAQAAEAEPKAGKKRKEEAADSDSSTVASDADTKRRKGEDGKTVVTILGGAGFRAAHQIVVDAGCPEPMETFDAAAPAIGALLTKALLAQGYAAPTPIQAQGWSVALQGRDMVAVAKTGSGKTCGFLLPALVRISERGAQGRRSGWNTEACKPTCLVLAPTRELAQQIAGEAEKFAHAVKARAVVIFGGVPKGDHVRELKAGADIVIATPGRLLDLAAGDPTRNLPPAIVMSNVNYLVLDEADRMLDMGFEPDIRKIAEQCKPSGKAEEGGGAPGPLGGTKRQTLFFTATWPKNVQRTARSLTSYDALGVSIGQGENGGKLSANPMVKQTILMVSYYEKSPKFHEILKKELGVGQTAVVFCAQKHVCDTLEGEIKQNRDYGFTPWCGVIHSGREQWYRDDTLKQFRDITAEKSERRAVLVATDVAARGLDIPGVAMVFVYDFGKSKNSDGASVESYVHRIGRTGRAGKTGKAWALFTSEDSGASELVEVLEGSGQEVPPSLKALGDAEWYKNMERENKKNFFKNRGKGGSKGGSSKGKGGDKGGKSFGGKGGGKDKGKGGKGKGGGRGFGS